MLEKRKIIVVKHQKYVILVTMTNGYTMQQNYELYDTAHIIFLCVSLLLFWALVVVFSKLNIKTKTMLIIGTVLTAGIDIALLVYSFATGMYDLEWYLPFHICNMFVLIYPLSLIFGNKVHNFFKDYIVFAGFGGCMLYMVFPINTVPYLGTTHFASVCVWLYHFVIGAISLYYVFSHNYKTFKSYSIVIVIGCLVVISGIINPLLNTNFLFTNPSFDIFPLNTLRNIFGIYAVQILAIVGFSIAILLQISVWHLQKSKPNNLLKVKQSQS